MPRWVAEAKKREEEKKAGAKKPQSSSVKNVNKKAQNSTFMGGGAPVKKAEKTYQNAKRPSAKARQVAEEQKRRRELEQHQNQKTYGDQKRATPRRTTTTSNNLTQHTTAAQRQKMGMPTAEDLRQGREHRRALANSVKDSVRRATSEENKSFMQRQKSGIQTEADRQYSEKLNQRRAEVAKNTGRAASKGVQDTLTGYGKTLADVDEMAKSNKNWTRAKASKMGISEDDTVGMAKVEGERQKSIKQAQELRRDLAEKQDKRQAEWDERTKNAKGLEKAWYGAVESGTGMATDALVGALTGTGTAGSLASMAVRTYGTTRGQAEKEGATENEDRAYAVLQAAKEVGTELMFPGAGLAKKTYGKVGLSVADRVANKLTKGLTGSSADLVGAGVRLLGGTAEENAEEFAGWGLDPVIKELAYGKNVRTREAQNLLKQESDELRSNLKSADDARSAAAYLGSDRFLADNIAQYKDAGLSDKQAREVAEKMRDYLTASLTGDTDRMGDLEDEIVTTVAGGSLKAMIKDYDVGELMDTFASTSVLTLATGLPATATTAMKGARIRENLGSEGLRALSQTAINFEDDEASLKGQAARDRLDSGKDLTSTQVFDLAKAQAEQIQKDEKRVAAMSNMADNAIKSEKLVTPKIGFRENGSVAGDEIITMNYVNESNNATEIISDLLKEEGSESLTDTEVQTGSRAIAGFKTGAFTVNDANALNYTNTTVRAAFEAATGVNLSQYVVRKNGQVDIPATNAATKDALFAMAADNFVKTAQAETANWMDSVKGDVVTQVTERMGAQGSLALQQALDDVDERDRSTYMMNANAADMMYQTARNMGTEWDSVKAEARKMFPDISETKLEAMYNAGLRDRADAANGAIGQQVRMGEAMALQNEPSEPKGKVFVDTTATPKGTVVRTFSEIASNLGVDIHLVDDLKTSTGGQANGQYVNGAIYINMNSDFESNIGYIFMHEVTHHLKQYAPEQFNELENLVREKWFGYNPEQMQNEIAKKIDLYKRNGQTLSEEEALEEIIADAAHEFINDRNFADQVAEQNPDIAKAILNGIRNALRMLRRLFAAGSIDDETHMNSLFSQLNILDEAEKLWLNAYTQAVQNKAAVAIDEWQDRSNRYSIGYHAGDLGKSTVDDYAHQGYSRGSGHFGFGTYFVGDEEQINSGNYGKRQHETVDFDKYNLFKPRDFEQGYKLHNALRTIDGLITDYSDFIKYKDSIFDRELWEEEYYKDKKVNTDIERLVDEYEMEEEPNPERKERIDKYISEMPEYYRENIEREAQKKYDEAQSREVNEDEIRERLATHYDIFGSYLYDNVDDYVNGNVESEIRYINSEKEVPYEQWYYATAKDAIKEYSEDWTNEKNTLTKLSTELKDALGSKHTESEIEDALLKTEEIVKGYQPEGGYRLDAEPGLDSGATVFMKQLGYEGVDVRHIPLMDNTGYGSVIYDLKGEDLARKQEIGTARYSITPQQDADYMKAVEAGDMDTAQRLVDEAARMAMPNTKLKGRWYHGTENEFTEFNFSQGGKNGTADGFGIYLTNDPEVASSYGNRMIEGYVNVTRPASALTSQTLTKSELRRLIKRTVEYEALQMAEDYDSNIEEAKFDTWISNYTDTRYAGNIDKAIDEVIKGITSYNGNDKDIIQEIMVGMGIRNYDEATRFYDILTETTGIDGFETKWGDESEMADPNTPTIALAFRSNQIKSADPVTYAEDGSVIPLSERFDPTNNDIRYSLPTTDADGKVLTDGQMEYFKNSQARDAEGRLVPVYHTTNRGGFTIFDPSYSDDKRSLFFASNWNVSQTYGRNADRKYRFEEYSFKSLNDFAKAYAENFSNNLNDPENDILEQVVNALRIHIEKNSMPAFDLGDTMFERVKNYMKIAEAGDVRADKYRIEMKGAYGGMVRASSYDELLGKLSRQMSNNSSKSGYYECYLNLENPLIVDAQNQSWNNIPYGEYSEDAVLAIKNLTVQDMGDGIYVNIWGDRKVDGKWQEFRESDTIEFEYLTVDGEYEIPERAWDEVYDFLVKQGLSSDYAYEHSDAFFDFNGLDTFDKDGRKVESDVRRYRTRELAALADAKGYDSVIVRNCYDIGAASHLKGEGLSDIYIAFSSNQVKDIDNENPTENPDIRYSITDDDEAMSHMAHDYAYDNSYEALAHYEEMIAADEADETVYQKAKNYIAKDVDEFYAGLTRYADGMKFDDPILEEGRTRMAKSKQDFFNSTTTKWNDRWLTDGEVLDIKSVKKAVRDLVTGTMLNSNTKRKYSQETVKKTLIDMRLAYFYAKQGRTDIADALLWHSAHRMIDGVEFYADDSTFEEYKGLRDYLKNTRIQLGEEYWSDVDYAAFRKENYGRLNLVKGETNVDKIYAELEEMFPGLFDSETYDNAPDQLMHMAEVLDSVQPYAEAYSSEYCAEWATDIASDLLDIMQSGKELQSTADKYKKRYDEKAKAMKARHAEAMMKVRQQRDEGIRKERVKFKEYVERKKEKQAHNKYFDSIQKSHKKLTDRLLSNTADSNIPQQYKKELAKLLAAFDLQTVGSKKVEARRGVQGQKTIKMAAIKTALNNIESRSGEFHVSDAITDIIDELLGKDMGNGNNRGIEGMTIDELNSSELARIDKLLKALVHEFNTYKTVKIQAKRQQVEDIGKAQVNSSLEHAQIFGQRKDYQNITGVLDKIVNMGEMTPAYMFRMLDPNNEGIGLMWKEIRRSFDRYVRNQNQLNDWMDEIIGEYHQKGILWNKYGSGELSNWRSTNYQQTFVLTNGAVTLTPAQMMSLYCLSKRNQAYGHMVGAGIVVAPVSFQAKIMSDVKKKADMSLPVILTDADIKHIVSKLTPDQIKVADKLQELMATKMAAWGNEASMNVLGIELFGEPDYFPIKSDKAALEKDLDADQFANAIRSFGFTKAVQPGARNAIMIDDIFDVVAEHCNNMNLYNSYSEAMNDFMKVYNYRDFREDGREYTVQQAIAHAYSRKATTYIMQFMKDLNGNVSGRSDAIENAYNTALGNAKKAAVFANLRVAAQQPTAIVRAFAEIDPKYIKGIRVGQGDMKEMMEHCPIALWKSWGYYDINMGKSIEDIMMNNGKWLEDKATDLYGALDNVTWTAIWQMVKAETRDKHPELKEGTDEFFEHCNERMSEIVDFTQVVDSPMHRSHDMRSKNMITKLATSFMAEPTLTFNMVKDGMRRAYEEYEAGSTKKAAGILQRTFNVFIIQAGTVAAFAAAIDALRKKKPDKDDENDRFLHLWWVNALENFKDNLKLWNNIYFVKDIASMFEGWDNNNLALQGWKNLATGWNQLTGNGYVKSSKAWYENMAYGLGYLIGIPAKTIMTGISNFTNMFGVTLPGVEMITEELDALPDAFKKDDAEIKPESMAGKFISIALSDDNKSVMDKVAEKMGYKPIGSNAVAADKNETKSDSKETKESSADIEKQLEEYRESLSDNLSEDQKDKLVKQYKKTLEKEAVTEAAMSEDFDVQAHIAEAQANFDYEMEKRSIKAAEMAAGKTGKARDEALWDVIAEGYTKSVDSGNMATIQRMREEFAKQGGDTEWFDAKIADKMKSAYKKTLYSSDEIVPGASLRQETMYNFMTEHGVSETEISDIVYHSYVARDLKAAMRIGNEDYIMDELVPLVAAGLSREDYEKLYKYRNMGAKTYDGKYTDPKYTKTTGTFVWPTEGVITSHFGYRNAPTAGASSNHPAIDIGAPSGTTVVAADGGVVIYAGSNGGYGNSVGVKHANGMVTYYNHLSAWNVKVGDQVAQGQPIANVGSTGISTGPHLDFKIVDAKGNPVDPEKYLNKR